MIGYSSRKRELIAPLCFVSVFVNAEKIGDSHMRKVLILAVCGILFSSGALAGGGCFGGKHATTTASTTSSGEATTAETPVTKPESKS